MSSLVQSPEGHVPLPPSTQHTPLTWRLGLLALVVALTAAVYALESQIGVRGQAAVGVVAFFALGAAFSTNLRAVNWRTIGWGIALQLILALLVLKVPAVDAGFQVVGAGVKKFIGFSNEGAKFVFGNLYDSRPPDFTPDGKETTNSGSWSRLFRPYKAIDPKTNQEVEVQPYAFQFAFVALPPILSSPPSSQSCITSASSSGSCG